MMHFKPHSYADKILVAIALSGEFNYSSLYLIDDNVQMLQRNARKMRDKSYISINGRGKEKHMRLRKKGIAKLKEIRPAVYKYFMQVTDNNTVRTGKGNEQEQWRKQRMGESMQMIMYTGLFFTHNQKPQLTFNSEDKTKLLPIRGFFYNSKEIKNADVIQRYKYHYTRISGLIVSSGGTYAMYNTNEGRMYWNNASEIGIKNVVSELTEGTFEIDNPNINSTVFFAKDMDIAVDILHGSKGLKDSRGFELLTFNNTYDNIHFILLNTLGRRQLSMITKDSWEMILAVNLFGYDNFINKDSSIVMDAYDKKRNIVYLEMVSGNITKLNKFINTAKFRKDTKFQIRALKEYKPVIKKYGHIDNLTIRYVSDKILDEFDDALYYKKYILPSKQN